MAEYTTQIKSICEFYANAEQAADYRTLNDIITIALPKIFDFSFPIFDVNYREELERKIIRHYFMREIGLETVGLWKMFLETRLNEIMPYYNELYKTLIKDFNPQYQFEYWKEGQKKDTGTSESATNKQDTTTGKNTFNSRDTHTGGYTDESETNGEKETENTPNGSYKDTTTNNLTNTDGTTTKEYFSDTPQGGVSGVDNENYLTTYKKIVPSGANTSTGTVDVERTYNNYSDTTTETFNALKTDTSRTYNDDTIVRDGVNDIINDNISSGRTDNSHNNVNDYTEHVFGFKDIDKYAESIKQLRSAIINIDMMIINDLQDLFMNIY